MSEQRATIADLHCHIFPAAEARAAGTSIPIEPVGGGYRFGNGASAMLLDAGLLDLEMQVEDMQRQGVGLRALAIPPFTLRYDLPASEGARWARAINEGIANAIAAHPDQFVGFATLPLQD
ncbi:MAG: hypothetical protein ACRD1H_05190, partial [Vicinamibacterales bacterium]